MKLKLKQPDISYIGNPIWNYHTYELAYDALQILKSRISKEDYEKIVQELNRRLDACVFKLETIPDIPNYNDGITETLSFSYYTIRNRLQNYRYIPVIHHRCLSYLDPSPGGLKIIDKLPVSFVVEHRMVVGFVDRIGITTCRIIQQDMSDEVPLSTKEYDVYYQDCIDYILDQKKQGNSIMFSRLVNENNTITYFDPLSETQVYDRNPEGPEAANSIMFAIFRQNPYRCN